MRGFVALALLAVADAACLRPLMFGDSITIANMYDQPSLRILDRNGSPVLTTDLGRVSLGSAQWKVLDTSKNAPSRAVTHADEVVLQNQHSGLYILQRNGGPSFAESSSGQATRIANKAAVFKLLATNKIDQGEITYGQDLVLENQYEGLWMLERDGGLSFTTDNNRISNNAAVWQMRDLSLGIPTVTCPYTHADPEISVDVAGSAFSNGPNGVGPVSNCFDDIKTGSNFCHNSGPTYDAWLRIDMVSAQHVSSFRFQNREDCCQSRLGSYEIWVGDASAWFGATSSSDSDAVPNQRCLAATAGSSDAVIEGSCDATGRYFFLALRGSNRIINLAEIEIFGLPVTSAPTMAPTGAPTSAPTLESIVAKLETNGLQAGLGYVFGYTGDNAYMCSSTAGITLCFKSAAADRDSWTFVAHDSAEVLAATDEETSVTMTDGVWEVTPGGPTFSSGDGKSSSVHYAAQCNCP